ncbi:hypothetical protein [Methanococcoides burtonii]|uniref:Uncharacterized protein n=1 Tax=Methanococcoides burtonii (strain DSM 6242 / NBRC 107633 / OCM 468 / ACE-M) TaxID=259564 RepID=Q12X47_METBU|nr:hypothetical protein [Methanococcoides burtonii]ABE51979.1 Hypothetical protein Mbur_1046 [Methanococcoides burtonii DSM 6242]
MINNLILKFRKKMPLDALLFFMAHIWVTVILLTMFVMIVTKSQSDLRIYALVMTLGLFILFLVPIATIGQNIVKNRRDIRKVLYYIPLLICGMFHTIIVIIGHTRIVTATFPHDSLIYNLLLPIQRLVEIAIDPITREIFDMSFPYNTLPLIIIFVVILPVSLFIYLLPSVDYDIRKITGEMKLIVLLPLLCAIIPVILQAVQMGLGLIDENMIKFFWIKIFFNISYMGYFLLMPILGILYIKHYNKIIGESTEK